MKDKSVGNFPEILVKLATSSPLPPPPPPNPKQCWILGKWEEMSLFGVSNIVRGRGGDIGMNQKPIQKLSLGAESYVTITRKLFSLCTHVLLNSTVAVNMVRKTSDKQISRTFQGFCGEKLQFLRTKIYLINQHSLTPFDYPIG